MDLSLIIPTCGRKTLSRTLLSAQNAGILPNDEVIVVGDGPQPVAEEICRDFQLRIPVTYLEGPRTRCWGHAQRNLGMSKATKETLIFIDDDDEYNENAISEIRRKSDESQGRIVLGRVKHRSIGVIWRDMNVRIGNVSTQMIVVPNIPSRLGFWVPMQGGDFAFLYQTVQKWPGKEDGIAWWWPILATHHPCPDDPSRY